MYDDDEDDHDDNGDFYFPFSFYFVQASIETCEFK